MSPTCNGHFRQATEKVTKNRRFKCRRISLEVVGGYYYSIIFAMSHSVDFTKFYKAATPLSATLPVNANTETSVQSFTLPAGKWRVFWAVRGFGGENAQIDMVNAGLKANGDKVQNIAVNAVAAVGTWRPYISCSYEANITSSTTFSTFVLMPLAGNVSAETTYLFALRVG